MVGSILPTAMPINVMVAIPAIFKYKGLLVANENMANGAAM
jgi:hypothetical protein